MRAFVAGLFLVALGAHAAAQTGDFLCDAAQSTVDTCVIASDATVPDGSALTFTAPNVHLRSKLTVAATARCSPDPPTPCVSDFDCTAPARCLRTKQLSLEAAGLLTIDPTGKIIANGVAVNGTMPDVIGPDGGSVTLVAHDMTLGGTVDVTTGGTTSIPAGHAGTIVIDADGSVTSTGSLDASTSRGGCGGSVLIGAGMKVPTTLATGGTIAVDGSTIGGTIHLVATGQLTASGMLSAENTNGDPSSRPACVDPAPPCPLLAGGGTVRLEAGSLVFTGRARARGKEGAGGGVRLQGVRQVMLDSPANGPAINVTGGDADAFCAGGVVTISASAGDVNVQRGAIVADGIFTGFGSDSGSFSITATGAMQCLAAGTPCASGADCAPGDTCVETGGGVTVAAPVSAAGGAGAGNGCFPCAVVGCVPCEISGTGAVVVSGPVDVGGGKQGGGGKVSLTGGGDLTVGPGAITSEAGDGGVIILTAGSRVGSARDVSGKLVLTNGTQISATALQAGRVGGDIEVDGCEVTLEPNVLLAVDGGSGGSAGPLGVVAHERLDVQSLATLSALPDGTCNLVYRVDESVAPDAVLRPAFMLFTDPTLSPCPECGNGITDPFEDCDGKGTCVGPGQVCLPPGNPAECTCAATCGLVPGVQPGEDCDGTDLGAASCTSLGFLGGTLACHPDCTFDTSQCTADVCGDGLVGPTEQCDPGGIGGALPSFGGATCASLGFPAGGNLTCAPDCSAIITVPHCVLSVTQQCLTDTDCPAGETCAGGCAACGNGFVDPGEQCDQGAGNGGAGNHCRLDCTLPRCGDGTVDFSHCAGNPDAACSSAADCTGGAACVPGEACDLGTATCIGGTNDGAPCCVETDCPGGDCPGDGCTANRDDVPGCCHCDCSLAPVTCGDCDDGNPCTDDRCEAGSCVHDLAPDGTSCDDGNLCNGVATCRAGLCTPGPAPNCDDHDRCTVDSCEGDGECRHVLLGFNDVQPSLSPDLALPACEGHRIPPALGRLVNQARKRVARAALQTNPKRAEHLVRRAVDKLTQAVRVTVRAGKHGLPTECASSLGGIVGDALARTACLLRAPLP